MPPSDLRLPVSRQSYQSPQSQRIYQHTKEKRVYKLENKNFENRPKGFYTTFNLKGKEVDYLDKGFKEIIANFVKIKIGYLKCSSSFPSKLQLHKHLKAGCAVAM